MKKKLIGLLICMLLISTAFPVLGINAEKQIINTTTKDSNRELYTEVDKSPLPLAWWLGVDQKQDKHCGYGQQIRPPFWCAQEFKPNKEKLIGIELWFFMYGAPPSGLEITVSVRKTLNGSDLTIATMGADPIKNTGTWVLFDFDDITVTPQETYFIVCRGGGGDMTNVYCWLFNANNSYEQGIAWYSEDNGANWVDMEDFHPDKPEVDFCFRTYHSKSKNKAFNFYVNLLNWLFEHFPNLFPILKYVVGY